MSTRFLLATLLAGLFAFLAQAQPIRQSNPSLSSGVDATLGNVTASGTVSAQHLIATGTITGSLTGAASLNVLKAGDTMTGSLTVTGAGIAASTGVYGGGICPSTASVCLNALPLAANAGAYFGGSVGVGTTNPDKLLTLSSSAGDIFKAQVLPGASMYMYLDSGGSGFSDKASFAGNTIYFDLLGEGRGMYFTVPGGTYTWTAGGSERMRLENGGNVGIGTTNPLTTLDLAGGLGTYSRTVAQLGAITPTAVGQMYFCNNCVPAKMVVSTGTSAANFADTMGGVFQ